MALDNAQFISELSIVDPPGTDPLSEGDDQIRTSKRAVFQSFPFVDKQVDLTADNLNDAALQDQANTFNKVNIFEDTIELNTDGTSGRALSWTTNAVNNWQWNMDNGNPQLRLRRFVGGVATDDPIAISSTTGEVTFGAGSLLARDASVSNPSYSFFNETGTGFFRSSGNTMAFAATGTIRFSMSNTLVFSQPAFEARSTLTVEGQCVLNAASDAVNDLRYQRGLDNRWQLRQNNDAGGNDWEVRRFNDAGAVQGSPIKFRRSDGHWFITKSDWPTVDTGVTGELFLSAGQFLAVSA